MALDVGSHREEDDDHHHELGASNFAVNLALENQSSLSGAPCLLSKTTNCNLFALANNNNNDDGHSTAQVKQVEGNWPATPIGHTHRIACRNHLKVAERQQLPLTKQKKPPIELN